MDFINSQLQRIQDQLKGLTASQRMLAAALTAIMVMTLILWGKYAGQAEYEPVLDQALSSEELAQMTAALGDRGIAFKTEGNKILVPTEKRFEALGALGAASQLPQNISAAVDEYVAKQINPWQSQSEQEAVRKRASEMILSRIVGMFPGVKGATVAIDLNSKRMIGDDVAPTAVVAIFTKVKNAPLPKEMVQGAADLVQGAVAGMRPENIKVVVNGRPARRDIEGDGPASQTGYQEQVTAWANAYRDKVRNLFQGTDVFAEVNVEVSNSLVEEVDQTYDKSKSISLPRTTNQESTETTQSGVAQADPGVGANIQTGGSGADGGSTSSESREQTQNDNYASRKETKTRTGAGKPTVVSATVRFPRSHFVKLVRGMKPNAPDPDDAKVEARILSELPKLKDMVKNCVNCKNPDAVVVDTYFDLDSNGPAIEKVETAGIGASLGVGLHAKEIALGGLALVSLFMVSMMVRKATPAPVVAPAPAPPPGPTILNSGELLAGHVMSSEPLMEGVELDEDAIKTQQMKDQVATMVKESPDTAAMLVKRWLNHS